METTIHCGDATEELEQHFILYYVYHNHFLLLSQLTLFQVLSGRVVPVQVVVYVLIIVGEHVAAERPPSGGAAQRVCRIDTQHFAGIAVSTIWQGRNDAWQLQDHRGTGTLLTSIRLACCHGGGSCRRFIPVNGVCRHGRH